MKIKAVLFDLGNTLVYSYPEETFKQILEELGIVRSVQRVREALIRGNAEFDAQKHLGLSAHEFYSRWNLVQLKHLDVVGPKTQNLAEEINAKWFKYAKFHLYPRARKTLQRLKQAGLKLGIITGGYEEDIEQMLVQTGLTGLFDVCVGADTTGKRKPHPAAFRFALERLDVKPGEAMFVGDNFEADYLGAKNVGMMPVLIRRSCLANQRLFTDVCVQLPSGVRAITHLGGIFEVLEEISP